MSIGVVERGWAALGEVIRRHRLAAGYSQETLAELSGLHWTYVSEIETGKVNISVNVLRRLACALQLKPSELLVQAEEDAGEV
jgi:transcriptional regulator with XRE-family HTH domain